MPNENRDNITSAKYSVSSGVPSTSSASASDCSNRTVPTPLGGVDVVDVDVVDVADVDVVDVDVLDAVAGSVDDDVDVDDDDDLEVARPTTIGATPRATFAATTTRTIDEDEK
jgi:hypothetical protein